MHLFEITITDNFNSIDFMMLNASGTQISPSNMSFLIEKGNLKYVEFTVKDSFANQFYTLTPQKVILNFNYRDQFVLNHKDKSELHTYMGTPEVLKVDLELANDTNNDRLDIHIRI